MKLRIGRMMIVAAAALALGSAAYGQEVNVRAKVPFDFVLDNRTYPAGEYAVQTVKVDDSCLYINKEDGVKSGVALTHPHEANKPAKKTMLLFHRIGGTYFLYQVWVEGSRVGREFPGSPTETQLALNGRKEETVIVAANIVH